MAYSVKTQKFRRSLKSEFTAILGKPISQDKAWELFKAAIATTVRESLDASNGRLPLGGVGVFEITHHKQKVPPNRESAWIKALKEKGIDTAPNLKWRISKRIKHFILAHLYGQDIADLYFQSYTSSGEEETDDIVTEISDKLDKAPKQGGHIHVEPQEEL